MSQTLVRDPCPIEQMRERTNPNKNTILVMAKNVDQAKMIWREIKHKYEHLGRVKFVSNSYGMLDGLNAKGMIIIYCGEFWRNENCDADVIKWFVRMGAKEVYETS